jgi:hypothetical protein
MSTPDIPFAAHAKNVGSLRNLKGDRPSLKQCITAFATIEALSLEAIAAALILCPKAFQSAMRVSVGY